MKIPEKFLLHTRQYVQIQTKLNLYIAKYGCKAVESYLDTLPLQVRKKDSKNLGGYIVNMVAKEYQVPRYELFEASSYHGLTEARQMLCVLSEKYLGIGRTELSTIFHRSRHFAKRLITEFQAKQKENHPLDKPMLDRYTRLDSLIAAYMDFKPKHPRS